MVGPSSSHTAGAVRIGMVARQLFGRQPEKAEVILHGSFAATGKGHGTDRALIAGLLGMMPDDMRIPDSYEVAKDMGMDFVMKNKNIKGAHRPDYYGSRGRTTDENPGTFHRRRTYLRL